MFFSNGLINAQPVGVYLIPGNLPWGLYVPIEWDYPIEGAEILDAYMDFDDFAQGNSGLPWYQSNMNQSKIYQGN